MSGSGGGGGDETWRPVPKAPAPDKGVGGGGGNGGDTDPCNLIERTSLNSVNSTALAKLAVGDVLNVEYQEGPPKRLLAVTQGKAAVGSITSTQMVQLISCITVGNQYVATVLSIRGAQCQVQIKRA